MTKYGIINYKGRPAFTENGSATVFSSYCSCGPIWREKWKLAHRNFIEHGCKVFWLMPTGGYNGEWGTTPFWTAPGEIHSPPLPMPESYFGIDEQARALLEMEPEARFFIRMTDTPPASWAVSCPDDLQLDDSGHLYEGASHASQLYLKEMSAYLRSLTRYCEEKPWADRIVGYVIYPYGEGATPLACKGYLFDQSPVMQAEFRAFVKEKYGCDENLQAAWDDPALTLNTVIVPGDAEFRHRQKPPLYWPEAAQVQRERDYFELQRTTFRRYLSTMVQALRAEVPSHRLCGIDALKGNMLGWMPHPIFTAINWKEHYGDQLLATGTTGMAEILDWPDVMMLATPHDYRNRWVGFGYDPEGIGDSAQLHGKVMFVEEDQRSYTNEERGLFGSIEKGEEEAILLRNLAASLSKGQQTYPMDVCVGYYESGAIQRVLQRRRHIEQDFLHRDRQEVPCVTMLIDDGSGFYTDFSAEYNNLAVVNQRIYGMNHCGVPTRSFLFDDLLREDFPPCHKLFLLPNCYKYDEDILKLLQAKLFRNGNVIVFGPGSGITDGQTTSADFAQRLLGINFQVHDFEYPRFVTIDNFDHPLTAGFGACDTFGDTFRYGPVLIPFNADIPESQSAHVPPRSANPLQDGGFTRLGTIALDNGKRRPGLVVKEFGKGASGNAHAGSRGEGDYAIVFTTAVPLPAKLLRNLAAYSGTHVYDAEDDVVYADSSMVAVHAVKPGPRTIHLPGCFDVWDVYADEKVQDNTDSVTFTVEKPVTRWFRLD